MNQLRQPYYSKHAHCMHIMREENFPARVLCMVDIFATHVVPCALHAARANRLKVERL